MSLTVSQCLWPSLPWHISHHTLLDFACYCFGVQPSNFYRYQKDVTSTVLAKAARQVVESCVHYVGADANTASEELLSIVSGIGRSDPVPTIHQQSVIFVIFQKRLCACAGMS